MSANKNVTRKNFSIANRVIARRILNGTHRNAMHKSNQNWGIGNRVRARHILNGTHRVGGRGTRRQSRR